MLLLCGNFPPDYRRLNLNLFQFHEIRHSTAWPRRRANSAGSHRKHRGVDL